MALALLEQVPALQYLFTLLSERERLAIVAPSVRVTPRGCPVVSYPDCEQVRALSSGHDQVYWRSHAQMSTDHGKSAICSLTLLMPPISVSRSSSAREKGE